MLFTPSFMVVSLLLQPLCPLGGGGGVHQGQRACLPPAPQQVWTLCYRLAYAKA